MRYDQSLDCGQLQQTSRDRAAATARGDLERALEYWTDDAIVLAPDRIQRVG
jgi:ketosteroid isomerase-like protein